MKKTLFLLIVPVFYLLFFSLIRYSQGPFYNSMLYDPTYVYLLSSLNLAQGVGVFHTDHPGSTVQIIGAVVIKVLHAVFGRTDDIAQSVLNTPESYANSIYITLIILNSIGIFIMGSIIKKSLCDTRTAFLFQLSSLMCFSAFRRLTQISSEVFLVFVILILVAFFIKFIYEKEISGRKMNFYMIAFGVLCGVAVVTKLSAVTMLIIPFFLLRGFIRKTAFLLLALITFGVIFFPIVSYPGYFIDYAYNTIIKSGSYGHGESNFLQLTVYINNLQRIFSGEILLSVIFILLIGAIIILFLKKNTAKKINFQKSRTLLLLIFLSMAANIVMISKNFWNHYLLVVQLLLIPSLFLLISLSQNNLAVKKNMIVLFSGLFFCFPF
ncbi:MAG: hypothetical protein ABI462_01185 [Ignavibacteria bacterium]